MRSFAVVCLTVLMLIVGGHASASGWRDLRIDASSDSRFDGSIQQMRDKLPFHHARLFDLVIKDLKTRLAPAEYRQQLDGLSYKQIARLASPSVNAQYLAWYGGRSVQDPFGSHNSSEGVQATVPSSFDTP